MTRLGRKDSGASFSLVAGDEVLAYFKGVDGLNAELREGITLPREVATAKLPRARVAMELPRSVGLPSTWKAPAGAPSKGAQLTLHEGYIVTKDLQDWLRACRDGQYDRRPLSIILNDNAGNEIRRWRLSGCWPKQWKIAGLDTRKELVVEAVTFVVEDMQIA